MALLGLLFLLVLVIVLACVAGVSFEVARRLTARFYERRGA